MRNLSLIALTAFSSLFAETQTKGEPQQDLETSAQLADIPTVSEAFGHIIGKNLKNVCIPFDIPHLIKGIEDAAAGKKAPMSNVDCIQAITTLQERIFLAQAKENLKRAEAFLSENAKRGEVVVLEKGKVQYQVQKQGEGLTVKPHSKPLVRYTIKTLDGTVLGVANEEELVSLDEAIPGMEIGLVGMKEGEKRTLYIHPDLAFRKGEYPFPPNSLLIFEIEIVYTN